METAIVVSLFSGLVAISIPALTYWLTKHREHETAWRERKLKRYEEFLVALSGVVGSRKSEASSARYADAANALSLVAPPPVLRALYAFQDEISLKGDARDRKRHDSKLSDLMQAMRADAQGNSEVGERGLEFRLFASGPRNTSDDYPPPTM